MYARTINSYLSWLHAEGHLSDHLRIKLLPNPPKPLYDEDTKRARTIPKALWPIVRRKLSYVHAAATLTDLRVPPGNRLEALKGSLAGRYSIRVNEQYRITFRFEAGHAWEVCCEDYHS